MTSPKLTSLLLIAACAGHASLSEVRAAQGSQTPVLDQPTEQASAPDEARVVSDLKSQYVYLGDPALGAGPAGYDRADATAIRSSVRKGEVLEFRVTSVFYGDPNGGPQREVDSIVSYGMDGEEWVLLGVQMEGTREMAAGDPVDATEPC